jgi:hypothetical protein
MINWWQTQGVAVTNTLHANVGTISTLHHATRDYESELNLPYHIIKGNDMGLVVSLVTSPTNLKWSRRLRSWNIKVYLHTVSNPEWKTWTDILWFKYSGVRTTVTCRVVDMLPSQRRTFHALSCPKTQMFITSRNVFNETTSPRPPR